jgi:hypothetical protein
LASKLSLAVLALSSVPVALAMMSRFFIICPIWSEASAEVTPSTGAISRSCFTAAGDRSEEATMRSGERAAMVSMLGSPRVPMSFGSFCSGTAVSQVL